jgi:amidase
MSLHPHVCNVLAGVRLLISAAMRTSTSQTSAAPAVSLTSSPSHAWMTDLTLPGASVGPLQGMTFALKDMYSVAGHRNSCGNPTWLKTHEPASSTAPCVQALLDAGARLGGITHMDELAYSLNGENVHYGTPVNHAAPDRIPGGSSSGSAVRHSTLALG